MQKEMNKEIVLNLLCVIVDREEGEKMIALLEKKRAFFHLAMLGKGTASSRILSYLGIGQTEKELLLSVLPAHVAQEALLRLDERLEFSKPGHGIAFTAKVHSGCYHMPVHFIGKDTGETEMEQTALHDLIMVVVNRGYTEEVMDVARKAGATGGTVLHARGCGLAGAEKFFGVTIQPEKEIIMIVAEGEKGCEIMGAIAEETGPGTDAGAVSFSLPLNGVKGVGRDVPQDMM